MGKNKNGKCVNFATKDLDYILLDIPKEAIGAKIKIKFWANGIERTGKREITETELKAEKEYAKNIICERNVPINELREKTKHWPGREDYIVLDIPRHTHKLKVTCKFGGRVTDSLTIGLDGLSGEVGFYEDYLATYEIAQD